MHIRPVSHQEVARGIYPRPQEAAPCGAELQVLCGLCTAHSGPVGGERLGLDSAGCHRVWHGGGGGGGGGGGEVVMAGICCLGAKPSFNVYQCAVYTAGSCSLLPEAAWRTE